MPRSSNLKSFISRAIHHFQKNQLLCLLVGLAVLDSTIRYKSMTLSIIGLVGLSIWSAISFFRFKINIFESFKMIRFSKLHVVWAMFACWCFLSILWSQDEQSSLYYMKKILPAFLIVILFILVPWNSRSEKTFFNLNRWLYWICLLIGFLEAMNFFRSPFSNYSLGSSIPSGFFNNTNSLAVYLTIFFPIVFISSQRKWERASLFFCAYALTYLTGSMLNSFIFLIFLFVILFFMLKKWWRLLLLIPILSILYVMNSKYLYLNHAQDLGKRYQFFYEYTYKLKHADKFFENSNMVNNKADSVIYRLHIIKYILEIPNETGGLGVGIGGFESYIKEKHVILKRFSGKSMRITKPHNFFLEILSDLGIPGIVFFSFAYLGLIVFLLFWGVKFKKKELVIVGFSLVIFIVTNLSISRPFFYLPFWSLVGIGLKYYSLDKKILLEY